MWTKPAVRSQCQPTTEGTVSTLDVDAEVVLSHWFSISFLQVKLIEDIILLPVFKDEMQT